MPSAKQGRKARPLRDVVPPPASREVPIRRVENLMAGFEQKKTVYDVIVPLAQTLPPFKGDYDPAAGDVLGDMIIEGATLRDFRLLSETTNVPPYKYLLRWIRDKQHPFSRIFYDAKAAQIPVYEERIIQEAEEGGVEVIETERLALTSDDTIVKLTETRRVDNVKRSELRIKAMQWSLAWMEPKKHSRHSDAEGGKPNDQLKNLFSALMAGPAADDDEA